jgi:glycosyltransferase involved in cell wall biosynthesis
LDVAVYRRCGILFAASELLADELRRIGLPRERIRVLAPGRDVWSAAVEPTPDMRRGRRAAALCVANWIPLKGIDYLLDALASLPPNSITLHLAGATDIDAPYTGRLRELLERDDIRDRCIVHGPLSRAEVAALYAGADFFVLPSFADQYGTVYGEAIAAGLPVVGWRAGNLPNHVNDGVEGLLVEPGDTRGLADALRAMADDPERRARLAHAAKSRAAGLPTWSQTAGEFFGGVREVVDLWYSSPR